PDGRSARRAKRSCSPWTAAPPRGARGAAEASKYNGKRALLKESYQLADDYTALHESAAIGAVAPRGQIAVAGPDRAAFLHGLLTNDTASLTAGRGCYAAWLTPQGRMLCDLHVLESGDMMLLDVPAADVDAVAARLEQFHFSEDVRIAPLTALRAIWVHGPSAPRMISSVANLAPREGAPYTEKFDAWLQYQNARVELGGVPSVIARIDQLGVPGFVIYADAQHEDEVSAALAAAGALHATPASLDATRLEAAYPIFGIDMTSATKSPRLGTLALGYLHRDFVEAGTAVDVQVGDIRARAHVNPPSTS